MSTSFSVSRDDVITAALRKIGAIGKTETPDTEDFLDCSFALNLIIKAWLRKGIPLWKVVEVSITTISGLSDYTIGPNSFGPGALTTDRPVRILDAFVRDSNGQDTPLRQLARGDYADYATKGTQGSVPNAFWYQALTTDGLLKLWPQPTDTTHAIHLYAQVAISDVTLGTDVMDFPSECYQALVWNLADEVGEDYECPADKLMRIAQKAARYKDDMEAWATEEASLFLSYDTRNGQ